MGSKSKKLRKAGGEVDRVRIKKASKTKIWPTCGHENKIKYKLKFVQTVLLNL